jgi:hypothetical protein
MSIEASRHLRFVRAEDFFEYRSSPLEKLLCLDVTTLEGVAARQIMETMGGSPCSAE